jgi:hypothetical protein
MKHNMTTEFCREISSKPTTHYTLVRSVEKRWNVLPGEVQILGIVLKRFWKRNMCQQTQIRIFTNNKNRRQLRKYALSSFYSVEVKTKRIEYCIQNSWTTGEKINTDFGTNIHLNKLLQQARASSLNGTTCNYTGRVNSNPGRDSGNSVSSTQYPEPILGTHFLLRRHVPKHKAGGTWSSFIIHLHLMLR